MDPQDNSVHSEDENEMNLINTTKTRKVAKIIDSDSEEDMELKTGIDENRDDSNDETNLDVKRTFAENNNDTSARDSDIIESESDVVEEEEVSVHNKSFPDERTAVEAVIYTTNSKGELINESSTVQKSSLSRLCDSESEEEIDNREEMDIVDTTVDPVIQPVAYKRPRKKKDEEKEPQRMTVKDAAKQRTEIRSESQRMLRESNVSLPYHKPKSYTIKEFLQKRSKLPSAAPLIPKAPPSVALKMSKDKLEEISKKIDERIKEVKQFYKSDSEDEDTDDPSEDIRSWLDVLVDNAVDSVEVVQNKDISEELPKELEKSLLKEPESMDYEFSLDDVNEDATKKPNISELIKDKLNIQPKLSGAPDDVIDLEDGATKVSAVKKLVEKFFQHTAKKVPHKHKVHLNVIGVNSGGEITSETVSMNVDEEEEPQMVETPGAKLKRLREELQVQMAQKRLELWKQKHEQGDVLVSEKKIEDEEGSDKDKDILDDEEEYELTETESESEEEEEAGMKPEKPRKKSAFIDEEADVDEDEDEEAEEDDAADDDENDADIEEAPEIEEFQSPKKKILRRIIKPFSADSDDEEEQSPLPASKKIVKYYTTDEDDFLPPNLPKVGKTPQRPQLEKNKSELEFLTPVTYLTGLQNLNSDSKFLRDSPKSPFLSPLNVLASQEENARSQVQKNLFAEHEEIQDTQANIEDLAQMCSGVFSETENPDFCQKSLEKEVSGDLPSTQDLLNLCSGNFSIPPTSNTSVNSTVKPVLHLQSNPEKEIKNLDEEQDQIISQLLDEDELERFKKKFESPLNVSRKTQVEEVEEVEEVNATGLIDSDDENELGVKVKKRKKLVFSDDEEGEDKDESEDEEEEVEEEIDLHDPDDEEQQLENEIVAQESSNFKLADFLDREAELSESEWGSEDEDEKGLDDLEFEKGDEEKFNENKIRSEIERIHMRQLLDEDNREVKILQELLLEDGELHGTGRKRQFRWKTLDSVDNGEFDKREDDDIFLDEEESEEQYRKMRYKREMFLKKKSTTDDNDDSILSDSQILKIGQQIFKQKTISSQSNTPSNKNEEECIKPFTLSGKRGSFLSRSDQVLQRLAEYNKVTTNVATTTKNSRGFVFQTVEVSETVVKDNNNKRKATEPTPKVIKKLRLDNISPAVSKNNPNKSSRAKKLFKNW